MTNYRINQMVSTKKGEGYVTSIEEGKVTVFLFETNKEMTFLTLFAAPMATEKSDFIPAIKEEFAFTEMPIGYVPSPKRKLADIMAYGEEVTGERYNPRTKDFEKIDKR